MSRFKPRSSTPVTVHDGYVFNCRGQSFAPLVANQLVTSAPHPLTDPTCDARMLTSVGFVLYCVYSLSGFANDWGIKLLGSRVYLSKITLLLLLVVWLLSGDALRGLQRPVGLWLTCFLILLLVSTPFSVWRGGSAALLLDYVPKSYLEFFYLCTFTTSLRRCRLLMSINIWGAALLVLTCIKFGASSENRFFIPGSLFFSNPNGLGLALLLGVTSFMFLAYQDGMRKRILGAVGILFCSIYMLKTGSRDCLISSIVLVGTAFLFSRNKLKSIIFALPVIIAALLTISPKALHRLLLFTTESVDVYADPNSSDLAAIGSQLQRRELLKTSLIYTIEHPLLGVGPDQFPAAVAGDLAKTGQRSAWLGTHNSYTQVSSECGIPAFVCYCVVLISSLRSNLQLYLQSQFNPALKEIANTSFCLFLEALVYAVSTFFFHIAYSGILPSIAGFSLALRLASEPVIVANSGSTRRVLPVGPFQGSIVGRL